MRLFKTNKSQASLQSSHDGRPQSQEQSPVEPAFPQHAQAHHGRGGQAHAQIQTQLQTDGANDPPPYPQGGPQYQRYEGDYTHPAHFGRSQSQRISPTTYSNPTVKLVAPGQGGFERTTIDEAEQQIYPSPPLNSSTEFDRLPEVPKSKRGFFGLSSSLVKDHKSNPHGSPAPPPQKLGRSISVRRSNRGPESQPNLQRYSVQDPSAEIRPLREENEGPPDTPQPLNPRNAPYPVSPEGLYQQPQQELSGDRLSITRVNTDPNSQSQSYQPQPDVDQPYDQVGSRHPAHYNEDIQHPTPQHPQYQAFPPPPTKPSNPQTQYPVPPSLQPKSNLQLDASRIRPPSQQSIGPPSPLSQQASFELQRQSQDYRNSLQNFQTPPTPQSQASMAPSGQNAQMRMSMNQQNSQAAPLRSDPMQEQGHNHGGQYGQGPGPPQGGNRHLQQNPGDQGRNSPQPSKSRGDSGDIDVGSLLQKHDDLIAKYSKVKKYYFEKDTQVQQLQNALAHQRLSLSRTSLDDSEYATRFNRLDGAINNLSFNIRKEWKAIPPWLQGVVNRDAIAVGTKEMTAVGRACITRWLIDEILDRYFHPGLEPGLSSQLKIIEKNVRRFAPPANTDEEKDAILSKICNWRLTTLDGLQDMLSSPQSAEYRANLTQMLVDKLTASLQMNLKDPPPLGLEGGVTMIIELAVGIAANLPQESRDVYVEYFMPGALITDTYMKIEPALPALSNPGQSLPSDLQQQGSDLTSTDHSSTKSGGDNVSLPDNASSKDAAMDNDADLKDSPMPPSQPGPPPVPNHRQQQSVEVNQQGKQSKRSMLGNLINKKPTPNLTPASSTMEKDSRSGSVSNQGGMGQAGQGPLGGKEKLDEEGRERGDGRRIRFAAFVAVEVRGRGQVLCRAPVYTI